jgi:MSHA pilin protein MshA
LIHGSLTFLQLISVSKEETIVKKTFSRNKGFTLIELIVVIVILGIMAAVAGPKFINLQTDARLSVVDGVEGSVRSAATLVYSKALIDGTETAATGSVTVATGAVTTAFGYPTADAAGIVAAVDVAGDIDATTTPGTFSLRANCLVTYTAATSATVPAAVAKTVSGC